MSPDPVRDEAERLVAAAIAAVSVAARSLSGGHGRPALATGSPECCVCPVCRVIAAMREPSPELSERLATGAGDLAAGITSLLRAFARPSAETERETDEGDEFWESLRRHARPDADGRAKDSARDNDPWHTATTTAPPPTAPTQPTDPTQPTAPTAGKTAPKMAKKAVAKKAVKKATPAQGGPTEAAAEQDVDQ